MIKNSYNLTNNGIASALDSVNDFLKDYNLDDREVIRTKLTLEESLLKYMDVSKEEHFDIKLYSNFGQVYLCVYFKSNPYNPFEKDDEPYIINNLLVNARLLPVWSYKNGVNKLTFSLKKKIKISLIVQILIAFGLALISGHFLSKFFSEKAVILSDNIFMPISDTIMGLLTATAYFLIFFSIMAGICNMGDISTFNRIGKKTVFRFLSVFFIYGVLDMFIFIPFFKISDESIAKFDLNSIINLLLDIIPKNFVTSFVEGNMLQIVFISIAISLFILILGEKSKLLSDLINQLNMLFQLFVENIIKLLPIVVFASVFSITISGGLNQMAKIYKLILIYLLGDLAIVLISTIRAMIKYKVKPGRLLYLMMPVLVVGISTSSSLACIPTGSEVMKEKYAIDDKLVDLGIPLGINIFKPDGLCYILACSFGMAEIYDVPITIDWIIICLITCYFMTIAMPSVAGGTILCLSILFMSLGIPNEALIILIAIDPIIDRFGTMIIQLILHIELILLGKNLDLIDEEKSELFKKSKKEDII